MKTNGHTSKWPHFIASASVVPRSCGTRPARLNRLQPANCSVRDETAFASTRAVRAETQHQLVDLVPNPGTDLFIQHLFAACPSFCRALFPEILDHHLCKEP